jgi:serine/threonine-protein kinase
MDTDRNLLFAVLALQAGLLDLDRFVEACTLWTTRRDVSLADLLIEQGWLARDDAVLVERLVEVRLRKHDGDARASLAAVAGPDVRSAVSTVLDAAHRDPDTPAAAVGDPLAFLREISGEWHPSAATRMTAAQPAAVRQPPGAAGRNVLFEEIGRGGMGRVLRGHDPELGRDLAVKVLREEHASDQGLEQRFVEEAQVGGQLQHPGVVPVYELGRFPDRRPFFTMKLVKGRTLAELLKERPDPADDLQSYLGIFQQVCQTVAYAHSKGVIHRDLKPANVMVGAFGEVQVMDWGLAKVLGQRNGEPDATATGTLIRTVRSGSTAEEHGRTGVVGTPAYMAPEQARGEVEAVDERADVFGLGAILCEILTGEPPYCRGDRAAVLCQAATGDVVEAFARLENCGSESELRLLCRDCLAPEREKRPRNAEVVTRRLATYQAAVQERLRAAELERAAAEARAVEERKRRRVALALAAAVLALVLTGAGGGLWVQRLAGERSRRDAEQRQTVQAALARAAGLAEQSRWREAAAVLDQAKRGVGDAGPAELRQRLEVAEADLKLLDRLDAIRQQRSTIVDGRLDKATAAADYAAAFQQAGVGRVGDDEVAVAARVRASPVAAALVGSLDDWASVTADAAVRSWLLGVARQAAPDTWADRFRDPAVWQDRPALQGLAAEALRDDGARLGELPPQMLASLGLLLGDSPEAVPLLRAAQRHYPADFWLSLYLGVTLHQAKHWPEAQEYDRVAVALRPDAAVAHNNLGFTLASRNRIDEAIAEFRTAIALDPNYARAHSNLGSLLRARKNLDGAVGELRQAIALQPEYARAHYNLGVALADRHQPDEATAEYRQALALDPKLAEAHVGIGAALIEKKDVKGAIAEYRRAIEIAPDNFKAHFNLGVALFANRDREGAIVGFRRAVELDPQSADACYSLGCVLQSKPDWPAAIAAYRQAIRIDPKHAQAHNNLGHALGLQRDVDGAVAEYRKAIEIDANYPDARCNLGIALLNLGQFAEGLEQLRRGHALGSRRPGWGYPSARWVSEAEYLVKLDEKLSTVLAGESSPKDAGESLTLAQLCQQYKRRHAAAVRFYAEALAAAPKLAADPGQSHRYKAACSAALAAAGRGDDATQLPDRVRPLFRRQAFVWLSADLTDQSRRSDARERLRRWQQDADLAAVRDWAALAELSEDERALWRRLWDDVAALVNAVAEKR